MKKKILLAVAIAASTLFSAGMLSACDGLTFVPSETRSGVVSITLSKSSVELSVGDTVKLTATASDGSPIEWSSSDTKVATVTSRGSVSGKSAGTATITAKCGDVTATCTVTVTIKRTFSFNATLGTDVKLEERDGKIYYVVTGGTFDYTATEYTEEEVSTLLQDALTSAFHFNLQANAPMANGDAGNWNGNNECMLIDTHTITVTGENEFEVAADITSLDPYFYQTHLGAEGDSDFKPENDVKRQSITLGGKIYTLEYYRGVNDRLHYWGCVGVHVSKVGAKTYAFTGVDIVEENGAAMLVISGVYKNYTKEKFAAIAWYYDVQNNGYNNGKWNGSWDRPIKHDNPNTPLIKTIANGEFTFKLNVTSLSAYLYSVHFGDHLNPANAKDNPNEAPDFKLPIGSFTKHISVGKKMYTLFYVSGSSDPLECWGFGLVVSSAPPADKNGMALTYTTSDGYTITDNGTSAVTISYSNIARNSCTYVVAPVANGGSSITFMVTNNSSRQILFRTDAYAGKTRINTGHTESGTVSGGWHDDGEYVYIAAGKTATITVNCSTTVDSVTFYINSAAWWESTATSGAVTIYNVSVS